MSHSNSPANRRFWKKKKSTSSSNNSSPKVPKEVSFIDNSPSNGYEGFKLYFPGETTQKESTLQNLKLCTDYLTRNIGLFSLGTIRQNQFFSLNYKLLANAEVEIMGWGDFTLQVVENTEYCLSCFGLAMHQIIISDLRENADENEDLLANLGKIRARLENFEPILLLKDIKSSFFGKLATVRGTVIKASLVQIRCDYMAFGCELCGGEQIVAQPDGYFTTPTKCMTTGCRAQSFKPLYSSLFTRTANFKTIKIQELQGGEEYEPGRTPRTLECDLSEDLVNCCMPGDDITITGVIKVRQKETMGTKKVDTLFSMFLNAVSLVNNKNRSEGSYGAAERITFNIDDYYAIQKIHSQPELFKYLVQSLCPSIYGHEMVKAGLLLALFGGTKSDIVRAESHVLVVGDPGLGKSQMLQACTAVAPRGVYVCGNTSSVSGLTVTMTRESGGDYALEAGALMLADQGCCCIDEFDKMTAQHSCLLEAMEQQSLSIAKAGIVCTLPTRTTILAAANPAGGHYNKAKTVAENLKISSPMLSRFDLIFIVLDQPNEEFDSMLSRHVMALHSKNKSNKSTNLNNSSILNTSMDTHFLKNRLKLLPGEELECLPHSLFRKYIAYAQKYVNPQLSDGAKAVLKEFYLNMRKQYKTGDTTPITTRQLHSLIRLTQARAKAELREEATESDAIEIIELMKHSLVDIFTDENGFLNTTRSQMGTGVSSKNKVIRLLNLLQKTSEAQVKKIFNVTEIRELSERADVPKEKFYSILDTLNIQGYLLNKGANNYQLMGTNF